jgi:hypothetical protein
MPAVGICGVPLVAGRRTARKVQKEGALSTIAVKRAKRKREHITGAVAFNSILIIPAKICLISNQPSSDEKLCGIGIDLHGITFTIFKW